MSGLAGLLVKGLKQLAKKAEYLPPLRLKKHK